MKYQLRMAQHPVITAIPMGRWIKGQYVVYAWQVTTQISKYLPVSNKDVYGATPWQPGHKVVRARNGSDVWAPLQLDSRRI